MKKALRHPLFVSRQHVFVFAVYGEDDVRMVDLRMVFLEPLAEGLLVGVDDLRLDHASARLGTAKEDLNYGKEFAHDGLVPREQLCHRREILITGEGLVARPPVGDVSPGAPGPGTSPDGAESFAEGYGELLGAESDTGFLVDRRRRSSGMYWTFGALGKALAWAYF